MSPNNTNEPVDFNLLDKNFFERFTAAPLAERVAILDEYLSARPDCAYLSSWFLPAKQLADLTAATIAPLSSRVKPKERKQRRRPGSKFREHMTMLRQILADDPDMEAKVVCATVDKQSKGKSFEHPVFAGKTYASWLMQRTMVVLDAATGLRYSEIAGLQWADIDWENSQIFVRRTWSRGTIGMPKSKKSAAPVPMAPLLAKYLKAWRAETPYAQHEAWVFASKKTHGRRPRVGNMLASDWLRPAAVKAGALRVTEEKRLNAKGEEEVVRVHYWDKQGREVRRFGFHNLRHSLSSYIISKKKTDVATVQRMLRHSKATLTLDKYRQTDMDELIAAQELMLDAIFGESGAVN